MTVLADRTIRRYVTWGTISIDPFDDSRVQPASIDLTLGRSFKRYVDPGTDLGQLSRMRVIDLAKLDLTGMMEETILAPGQHLTLWPGQFCLGTTNERVSVADTLVGRVEGKSSLGRLGLICHATAGFIDPGFDGNITLEFFNMNPRPIVLHPDLAICQISFMKLDERASRPYGHPDLKSKYQGQVNATESKYAG
jgi:dCTP deaminase